MTQNDFGFDLRQVLADAIPRPCRKGNVGERVFMVQTKPTAMIEDVCIVVKGFIRASALHVHADQPALLDCDAIDKNVLDYSSRKERLERCIEPQRLVDEGA